MLIKKFIVFEQRITQYIVHKSTCSMHRPYYWHIMYTFMMATAYFCATFSNRKHLIKHSKKIQFDPYNIMVKGKFCITQKAIYLNFSTWGYEFKVKTYVCTWKNSAYFIYVLNYFCACLVMFILSFTNDTCEIRTAAAIFINYLKWGLGAMRFSV